MGQPSKLGNLMKNEGYGVRFSASLFTDMEMGLPPENTDSTTYNPENFPRKVDNIDEIDHIPTGAIELTSDLLQNAVTLHPDAMEDAFPISRNFLNSCSNLNDFEINLFLCMLNECKNHLTAVPAKLKQDTVPSTYVIDLKDISDIYHIERAHDQLSRMMGKYIEFIHPIMVSENQNGYISDRVIIGHRVVKISSSTKVALLFDRNLLKYLIYTGKDLNGKLIGAVKVPAKKARAVRGNYVKRLFMILMGERGLFTEKGATTTLDKLIAMLNIPKTNAKFATINKRILAPLVEQCKETHGINIEIHYGDENNHLTEYVKTNGKTNIHTINFRATMNDKALQNKIEYLRERIKWADTANRVNQNIWDYLSDSEAIEWAYKEAKKVEEKANDPSSRSVTVYNQRSCFNRIFINMIEEIENNRKYNSGKAKGKE